MSTETLSEEIARIESRLEEIESQHETEQSESEHSDLVEEEHRLQTRLQELMDQAAESGEGLAEEMVKSDGANADEIPRLPSEEDE